MSAAHLLVKASQGQVLPVHDVHLGTQSLEDAGELNGDVASADDGDLQVRAVHAWRMTGHRVRGG